MLLHHKKVSQYGLIFFALIALGVLVSVGIILFNILSSTPKDPMSDNTTLLESSNDTEMAQDTAPILTPEELKQSYNTFTLQMLEDFADTTKSIDVRLNALEQQLLSIRVPTEYQSTHLQTVLAIARLRAEAPEEIEQQIEDLLQQLVSLK